jgi:hypothetical protein
MLCVCVCVYKSNAYAVCVSNRSKVNCKLSWPLPCVYGVCMVILKLGNVHIYGIYSVYVNVSS